MSTPHNNNGPRHQWSETERTDGRVPSVERKERCQRSHDKNKRPLSSSSASSSSSSSLPRHVSKKLAASISEPGPWSSASEMRSPAKEVVQEPCQMETVSDDESQATMDTLPEAEESDQSEFSSLRLETSESSQCVMDKVVNEILITERAYVRDLEEIIEGYLDYIIHNPELPLTSQQISQLFGNIEDIHGFNSSLLEKLEECDGSPVLLAQCFVDHNEGFSIYTNYCTNYPDCMSTLTACMREKEIADAFRERQHALNHALPLGSYLLKPVQRILKYHLLLQSMLTNSDESLPGYDTLKEAFDSMTDMAQHINEMKRRHEDAVRIQEIQSVLYQWQGEDLTTYGELLLEDSFRMYGAKGHRSLFLFEKALLITKRREDGSQSLICKDCIRFSNLMLIESIPKEPLSFHVIPFDNPRLQYTMQAKDVDQKRKWCHEIKRLILENYNVVIPEKAKALVMMLGKGNEREETNVEHADPKRHAAPEYLEKRRGGRRKSGTFIPDFVLKSQRGKKGQRKSSEFFLPSPKNSPPHRRKMSTPNIQLPSLADESGTLRSRTNKSRERPRSKSIDYGLSLLHLRGQEKKSTALPKSPEKESSPESGEKKASAVKSDSSQALGAYAVKPRHTKRHASFRIATELNRVDSNSFSSDYRLKYRDQIKEELHSSIESLDTDSDMDLSQRSLGRLQSDDEYVTLMCEGGRSQPPTEDDSEDEYMTLRFPELLVRNSAAGSAGKSDRYGDYVELNFSKLVTERLNGAKKDDKTDNKDSDQLKHSGKGVYDNVIFGDAYRKHVAEMASRKHRTPSEGHSRPESPIWLLNNSSQESLASKQGKSLKTRTQSFPEKFERKSTVNRSHSFSGVQTESPVRQTSTPRLSLSSLFHSKSKTSPRKESRSFSPQRSYTDSLRSSFRTTISELYHTLPNLRSRLRSHSEDELASNDDSDLRLVCSAECSPDHRPPFLSSSPFNWETDSPMTSTDDVRPSPDIWNDLEEYIANSSDGPLLPKFPIPEVEMESGETLHPPSESTSDTARLMRHGESSPGDSFMGTLKTKVTKVKSKWSSFRSRQGSDSRSTFQSGNHDDGSDLETLAERERKSKLVYQLARSYSAKLMRDKKDASFLSRQFLALGKDNKNDNHSSGTAKSGVTNKPIELGAHLPRQRPPRPQHSNRDIIIGAASVPSSTLPSKESSPEKQIPGNEPEGVDSKMCVDLGTMSDPEGGNLDTGEEFIRGLETLVSPSVLQDSGSDFGEDAPTRRRLFHQASSDGGAKDSSFDSDSERERDRAYHPQGLTIRDTIKMLEERSRSRNKPPLPRVVVNRREKGHMIKERLKNLELNCSATRNLRRRNFYEKYYHDRYESDSESMKKPTEKLGERRTRSAERHQDQIDRMDSDSDAAGAESTDSKEADPEVLADNLRGYVRQVLERFET